MQFDCTLIQLKKRIISYFFADVVNTVLYLVRLHQLNLVTVPEHVSTNLHARFKRIQTLTREYVAKLRIHLLILETILFHQYK
jgi:IS4 transposase